jgi:phospholipase A1
VSRPRRPLAARLAPVALGACVAMAARGDVPQEQLPHAALRQCAIISNALERLACYDRLAGRAATPPAAAAPPVAAPPAARPPPAEEFGLSPAQRPAVIERPQSISARIVAFGRSANARPTLKLDNGQLWELDAADALLAVGDAVTIRHGALTSFLLDTPGHRTHHVRRLR